MSDFELTLIRRPALDDLRSGWHVAFKHVCHKLWSKAIRCFTETSEEKSNVVHTGSSDLRMFGMGFLFLVSVKTKWIGAQPTVGRHGPAGYGSMRTGPQVWF